jgi:membrane protease YdiL (CAAX protease family)
MDQPADDPLFAAIVFAVLLSSGLVWLTLLGRWRRGEPLLPYEPRAAVPWGALVAMLTVLLVGIALATSSGVEAEPGDAPGPLEVAQRLIVFILFHFAIVGVVLSLVTALYRATLRDFGLPAYAEEIVRDVRIGIVACLAALAPVYGVQLLMLYLFGPSLHPLVEMVTSGEPNLGLLLLASVAAVVVAPVNEEVFFRLLLQGWLEKMEDQWVRQNADRNDEARLTNDEARATNDDVGSPTHSSFVIRHSSLDQPPPRGLFRLPHGWFPILASALLFAAAHFGYGPDPIAIFFLALVLGYVYQRTHRIVPCIVAHGLFNSLAMLVLWRMVLQNVE